MKREPLLCVPFICLCTHSYLGQNGSSNFTATSVRAAKCVDKGKDLIYLSLLALHILKHKRRSNGAKILAKSSPWQRQQAEDLVTLPPHTPRGGACGGDVTICADLPEITYNNMYTMLHRCFASMSIDGNVQHFVNFRTTREGIQRA